MLVSDSERPGIQARATLQHGLGGLSTATAMLDALRARTISAIELLDLHLLRIARYNPELNAIVARDDEQARRTAHARQESGVLLGLPLTIKDVLYTRGLPTTGGVSGQASMPADQDALTVARLRAAGAVLLGKTNVPPNASDWQTTNPVFGRTSNPWDLTRTPGGSTGGGAAAVAAGLTPLEIGTDLAGSIRLPAAFCGIYGHTPSGTLVPRSGRFGTGTGLLPNSAVAMTVQGPLARSAEDLELVLDVIKGPDVGEEVAWHVVLPPARHERIADFRIATLPFDHMPPLDTEIAAAFESLLATLRRAGARVEQVPVQAFVDLQGYYRLYLSLKSSLMSMDQPRDERRQRADALRVTNPNEFMTAIAAGLMADAADYVQWFGQREHYSAAYRTFFHQWDILLVPITMVCAFPHTEDRRALSVNGIPVPYGLQDFYPGLCNLSGHPGTAFPLGSHLQASQLGCRRSVPTWRIARRSALPPWSPRRSAASCHQRATTNRKLDSEHHYRLVVAAEVRTVSMACHQWRLCDCLRDPAGC